MSVFLEIRELYKSFPHSAGLVEVLQGCDLLLAEREAVAITGASGSGKSTFLNIVGSLDWPTRGQVIFKGELLDWSDQVALTHWRRKIVGFVFQFHFLLPDFTALENLLVPVRSRRPLVSADLERAREFLAVMGLSDRAEHLPGELSGGEQQRVAIARAFMNRPAVILADEPFGNLDLEISARLSDMLFRLREQEGTSLVIVTHDPQLASMADRTLRLDQGILNSLPRPEGGNQ